jgi:hypothetical protein
MSLYLLQSGYAETSTKRYPRQPETVVVGESECATARFLGFHHNHAEPISDWAVFKSPGKRRYWFQLARMARVELDEFTRAYIECALWSSTDNADDSGGEPLDKNYDVDDIAPEALRKMIDDCKRFQSENAADLTDDNCLTSWGADAQGGHDFWLTRQGHGCGFWETDDWREDAGERLTQAAKRFGECNFYPYRGKLYL